MLPGSDDVIRWVCLRKLFILFIAKIKAPQWRRRLSFRKYSHLFLVGIIIRFLGEANTEWSEEKSVTTSEGKTENEVTQLKGHEEYFKIQYYLLGGKNSKYKKQTGNSLPGCQTLVYLKRIGGFNYWKCLLLSINFCILWCKNWPRRFLFKIKFVLIWIE